MNDDLMFKVREWWDNLTPKEQEAVLRELNWYYERKEQLKGSEDEPSTQTATSIQWP